MTEFQHKKHFGQHFLHDRMVIDKIVQAIQPHLTDCMVEIGPGLGALSQFLVPHLARLHVIEIDPSCVQQLAEQPYASKLAIHHQDVLTFDFSNFDAKFRLVGNLPYNISTPLLFHCLSAAERIVDMHFMVQKEVADRMVAQPNNKTYGRLSVMIQHFCAVESLFVVSPRAFSPPPKVMSAVCRLVPRPDALQGREAKIFAEVVRVAFLHRRKQLGHNLKRWFDKAELEALGVAPTLRAENLTPEDFLRLALAIARK